MMPTPDQIKAARAKAGLTQLQAAELAGVTRVTWARYECGTRNMRPLTWLFWQHLAGLEITRFKRKRVALPPVGEDSG